MELYVPTSQLKEVSDVLAGERVTFAVTDKTFTLVVEGKEIGEVTEVKAELLEIEVPGIYHEAPPITQRAFRLPSGRKILLTDGDGNFVRLAVPPPGWER